MRTFTLTLLAALLYLGAWAQAEQPRFMSADTASKAPDQLELHCLPEHVSVKMANGRTKSISAVQAGDTVITYANDQITTTLVQQVDKLENIGTALTQLYLRPVDELAASRSSWPMVPALLLEATPCHPVQTTAGRKRVEELVKGDVLYCYESATGSVSAWKVGLIQVNAGKLSTGYNLITETGTYLAENVVVLGK
ncbi:hypothetical protein [Telluribacter sp. SYSU D00476]|uniref:hypothetical protein n=1 Tax=Telluribacter sp. SYSU D00476 TaxID=2811430 RepID=UPI001FF46B08|nr:hypothetical protein [Telluribacter sp. SYSU D00476]